MSSIIKYQYMRVRKERHEWLGNRYFRIDWESESVVQVCVNTGQEKRGRGHVFGVYLISRQTLFSNYMGMNYTEACTKRQYEKAFEEVVKFLK